MKAGRWPLLNQCTGSRIATESYGDPRSDLCPILSRSLDAVSPKSLSLNLCLLVVGLSRSANRADPFVHFLVAASTTAQTKSKVLL